MKNNIMNCLCSCTMSKYTKVSGLGSGTYSDVYKGKTSNGENVALKICDISNSTTTSEDLTALLTEIIILINTNHTNIIRYRDVEFGKKTITLVMELMTMNLRQMYHKYEHRKLPLNIVKKCLRHVARGLNYLHTHMKISHCDIKPDNILYNTSTETFKIADFNSVNIPPLHNTAGCTIWYRAPESLVKDTNYSIKSDIWSLGCVLYELLTGKVLFNNDDEYIQIVSIVENIECSDCKFMEPYKHIKKTGKKLDRIKNEQAKDLLEKMLKIDPSMRISAKDVLKHPFLVQ